MNTDSLGMNILFLCRRRDLGLGQASLANALERQGAQVTCVGDDITLNVDIATLLAGCAERPDLILHPELDFPLLPTNITEIDIPTACLQIDTYAYTDRRISWSMLFDFPIVFHPGYEEKFRLAGHPGVLTFYHAASLDLFDKPPLDRMFDVGSVGRTHSAIQQTRLRVLKTLAGKYRLNEWERPHTFEEMAEVYRRSKIVVNVPRDDFPQDANMRAFEAMAAGCLLISRIPTELTSAGFEEGVHFVGYHNEKEIFDWVAHYLADESRREEIARAGQNKVLREHTYDNRARQLLDAVNQKRGKFFAPARNWPKGRVRLHHLNYYAAHGVLDCTQKKFNEILLTDPGRIPAAISLIGRARFASIKGKIKSIVRRSKSQGAKDKLPRTA